MRTRAREEGWHYFFTDVMPERLKEHCLSPFPSSDFSLLFNVVCDCGEHSDQQQRRAGLFYLRVQVLTHGKSGRVLKA